MGWVSSHLAFAPLAPVDGTVDVTMTRSASILNIRAIVDDGPYDVDAPKSKHVGVMHQSDLVAGGQDVDANDERVDRVDPECFEGEFPVVDQSPIRNTDYQRP